MRYKYIRVDDVRGDLVNEIFLFSINVEHKLFSRRLLLHKEEIVSAGFAQITTDENNNVSIMCYGESTSLGIKSIPKEDSYLATLAYHEFSVTQAQETKAVKEYKEQE